MFKHLMDRMIGITRQRDVTLIQPTSDRPNTHQDTLIQLERPRDWRPDSSMCASGALITPAMDISEENFDD